MLLWSIGSTDFMGWFWVLFIFTLWSAERGFKFHRFGTCHGVVEQYGNTATLYQLSDAPNGNRVIKYPVGIAIMTLPFFVLGHLYALVFGYTPDGFSAPYQWMVLIANWFYVIVGFIYSRKLLLRYFSIKITGLILIILFLGTNYLYMATLQTGISHVPLFALYAMSLYFTAKWHDSPTYKRSAILGLFIGLMIIVRHVEILFLIVPIFWKVNSFKSFFNKYFQLVKYELPKLLLFSICIIAVGSIQLFYWKSVTGDWLFYSYDNPGEGFDFLNPYTFEYLFSFRKGWLLYTPLMILGVLGIFLTIKKKYEFGIGLLLFFCLNIWVISSWSCWWYAGSFSQRGIIQSYPILALGIGVLLSMMNWTRIRKIIGLIVVFLLVMLNVFQTWQMHEGIMDSSRMTKDYYFASFGRIEEPANAEELLMVERSTVNNSFPTNLHLYNRVKTLFEFKKTEVSSEQEFADFPRLKFREITSKDHAWIKITGSITVEQIGADEIFLLITAFGHKEKKYNYTSWPIVNMEKDLMQSNKRKIEFWYLTPEVRNFDDVFILEGWNRAKSSLVIEDLLVETFERK